MTPVLWCLRIIVAIIVLLASGFPVTAQRQDPREGDGRAPVLGDVTTFVSFDSTPYRVTSRQESPPAAPAASDTATLQSTPWTLVEFVRPDGSSRPVLPGKEVVATFEEGRLFGNAGCNMYDSVYVVDGSALSIPASELARTLMYCSQPAGILEQEDAYLAALRQVTSFRATPETLTLYAGDGATLLTYRPQPQTPLEGTRWIARFYNALFAQAVVSPIIGTEITAQFDAGRVTGSAGCNTYTASYALAGTAITIAPPASAGGVCTSPPGVMEQEATYLAALPMAMVYRIDGNRLTLRTADGGAVAIFDGAPRP